LISLGNSGDSVLSKFLTKSKFGLLSAIVLIGGTCSLRATPIYSCVGGSACDGNLYAIWVVSQTATTFSLEVDVQVTNSYTGSMTDSINGLAIIPDTNGSFTSASLLSNPVGTWTLLSGGLSAAGCDGSGATFICAQGSGNGAPLFSGSTPLLLSWVFLITGTPPSLGDTAHLKYHYVNTDGEKVGSLGSFDVGIQCIDASCGGGGGGQSIVPEPVSFFLAGSGLIGMCFIRLRRPRSH
jgi:hypothetical protein